MEKIFNIDNDTGAGADSNNGRNGSGASSSSSEKEEGEVGEAGEGERFKFWIKVDVAKVAD